MAYNYIFSTVGVFFAGGLVILLLVSLLSGHAVRPIAQSYEKQKQFITDANHELKTPLTLILTNVDIAESEVGQNEWLDDIRSEGERMSALIRRLISLARMDELLSILLDNAVKYCDRGGTIRITLKRTGPRADRRRILLTVDNTYATVGSLNLNLLFEHFYRSDRARTIGEGFGIGLSMAKVIVEKHNGKISAQGISDSMIRFKIRL